MWTLILAFLVRCLWVLEPLRPCDVRMCVALDGVRLGHARDVRLSVVGLVEIHEQYLSTGESDGAFHFDVCRVTQITVYVHAHALHDKFVCLGRLISL